MWKGTEGWNHISGEVIIQQPSGRAQRQILNFVLELFSWFFCVGLPWFQQGSLLFPLRFSMFSCSLFFVLTFSIRPSLPGFFSLLSNVLLLFHSLSVRSSIFNTCPRLRPFLRSNRTKAFTIEAARMSHRHVTRELDDTWWRYYHVSSVLCIQRSLME